MKLIDFSKLFPWSTTYTLTKKVQPFGTQYQGVIAILLLKDWGPWPPSNIFAIIKLLRIFKNKFANIGHTDTKLRNIFFGYSARKLVVFMIYVPIIWKLCFQ